MVKLREKIHSLQVVKESHQSYLRKKKRKLYNCWPFLKLCLSLLLDSRSQEQVAESFVCFIWF